MEETGVLGENHRSVASRHDTILCISYISDSASLCFTILKV